MEPKKVTLRECVELIQRYQDGEVTIDDVGKFGKNISVRMYVPMMEKLSSILRILLQMEISETENSAVRFIELYKNFFFYVELQLYGQIDLEEQGDLVTYDVMDMLYPFFHPFIKSYCEDDLNVYKEIVQQCLSFNGIMDIAGALKDIDVDRMETQVKANAELVESLKENKELITDLKDIYFATDSTTRQVVKQLKDMTVREVMDKTNSKLSKQAQNKVEDAEDKAGEKATETTFEIVSKPKSTAKTASKAKTTKTSSKAKNKT